MKEIIMTFKKDGTIATKTEGFKGSSCTDATEFLKSLGDQTEFKRTQAWYERAAELNQVTVDTNYCG